MVMKPDHNRPINDAIDGEDASFEDAMVEILRSIKSLRFGSLEITVHDSRVVQIERKEKVRLAPAPRARAG
jgi:hypothetical protein